MMSHGRRFVVPLLLAYGLLSTSFVYASLEKPLPLLPSDDLLLQKAAITIGYNPRHRQADWVAYPLGARELVNCVSRSDNFREDESLNIDIRTKNTDFKNSGYDRGHLSPAGDNKLSTEAMHDSFLLSNISPQLPRFNQGIWAQLEGLVRAWALDAGETFVTTGPVLRDGLPSIGATRVSVPESFYKVVYNPTTSQAIGILMPQNADGAFRSYVVSVRQIEEITRLNLLAGIPNEASVEARVDLAQWNFNAKPKYLPCPKALGFFELPKF